MSISGRMHRDGHAHYSRPDRDGLIVVFSRDVEEPQKMPADSYRAAAIAITAVATRLQFLPGDIMMRRLADDVLVRNPGVLSDLPEV